MTEMRMRQEAIRRLEELTEKYSLSPNLLEYFKEGRIYYSYLAVGGFMPSIDSLPYDPRYEAVIKEFEQKTGSLVYHAVETETMFGTLLSLLFVSNKEDRWDAETLFKDYILTFTVNIDSPDLSEYGDIPLMASEPHGALIRRM